MKKHFITLSILFCFSLTHAQLGLYLGLTGGAGAMLTHQQVKDLKTSQGFQNLVNGNDGWSAHGKAQALLGIWRVRFGYQFLYNFSSASVSTPPSGNSLTP